MRSIALALCTAGVAVAQTPPPAAEITAEQRVALEREVREAGLSDAAVTKLSGDQIHDILRDQPDPPAIVTIAVLGFFLTMMVAIVGTIFALQQIYRQRAETLRLMVERGVTIPPELIAPAPRPASDLRRGLVLVAFGLGLGIFVFAVSDVRGMWTMGLVPLLVGAGYLIAFRATKEPRASGQRMPASN